MIVHLVIDVWNKETEHRRRAERDFDLEAVPRIGEVIDASKSLVLRVNLVRWMLDGTPWLTLGRADWTISSATDEDDPVLTLPENYVDELRQAGWTLEDW